MRSLLQTKEWAALRQTQGWQAHRIEDTCPSGRQVFVLEKKLPLSKSFLYVPEIDFNHVDLENFLKNIENLPAGRQELPQNSNRVFLRLEILNKNDEEIIRKLKEKGFIKAFEEIQPEFRQIIPIDKPIEEILAGMKPKGRYNIKIAQKNNIRVRKSDNINEFYQLFIETARRDGFSVRPKDYFQNLLEILSATGYAELYVAYFEDEPVAAEIITFYDGVASYLYGASSTEHRNLMAPYLLHFEMIKRAQEKNCKIYDLLAVAPLEERNGELVEIGGHKHSGISRFKRQFGGETLCLVGSYDLVFKPLWYKIFKIAEKIRRR